MTERPTRQLLFDALAEGSTPKEVSEWLDRALAAARAAWPTVEVHPDDYERHLLAHAKSGSPLSSLHASDLYLAAACSHGNPAALAAFEVAYGPDIAKAVRRVSRTVDVDEVVQALRESLFVGRRGGPPKLHEYGGRGDLRAWLRVVATRAALNAVTRGPKERLAEDDAPLIDAAGGAESAEVQYFRLHYEAEVKVALSLSLAALSVRERLLLRQHYIDQLTLDDLARLHAVHVATVKRQLASARASMTDGLKARLSERLNLSPSELQSVLAIVQSRLQVTMRRLLPDESAPD